MPAPVVAAAAPAIGRVAAAVGRFARATAKEYAKRKAIDVAAKAAQKKQGGGFFKQNRLLFILFALAITPGCLTALVVLSPIVLVVIFGGAAVALPAAALGAAMEVAGAVVHGPVLGFVRWALRLRFGN